MKRKVVSEVHFNNNYEHKYLYPAQIIWADTRKYVGFKRMARSVTNSIFTLLSTINNQSHRNCLCECITANTDLTYFTVLQLRFSEVNVCDDLRVLWETIRQYMTHNALHISLLCVHQAFRESSFVQSLVSRATISLWPQRRVKESVLNVFECKAV